MPKFHYLVTVEAENQNLADRVIEERIDHDEPYVDESYEEFLYRIGWERAHPKS